MSYTAISEGALTADVHHIVYESDLRKVTQRAVFQKLENKYGISMDKFKTHIYERAVEEARLRIQNSPELQKLQQINNPKYYYHGDIVTKQQQKYYNTIYNTNNDNKNNNKYLNELNGLNPHNNNKIIPSTPINYQDVKNHYIGRGRGRGRVRNKRTLKQMNNNNNNSPNSGSGSGSGSGNSSGTDSVSGTGSGNGPGTGSGSGIDSDPDDNTPPKKRRKYNDYTGGSGIGGGGSISPRKTAQSTREADKDTIYEHSDEFKQIMGKERGTWREAWEWITNYAEKNDLKISNRKIRCDDTLKIAFKRNESSVSGVSRLIWKHLKGAVELDENGNFKKLIYRKRKPKKDIQSDGDQDGDGTGDDQDADGDDGDNDDGSGVNGGNTSSYVGGYNDNNYSIPQHYHYYNNNSYYNNNYNMYSSYYSNYNNIISNSYNQNQYQYNQNNNNMAQLQLQSKQQMQRQKEEEQQQQVVAQPEPIRTKRRYRKRKRDENGNIIKRKKKSGLTRLCHMSDELIVIVGNDGPLPRNKITKGFWDYTEEQGLKKKGRIITCDAALKKIWTDKEEIHMYDVQKGLKVHITTMTKDEEHKWRLKNPTKFNDHYDTNKTQTKTKNNKKNNKNKTSIIKINDNDDEKDKNNENVNSSKFADINIDLNNNNINLPKIDISSLNKINITGIVTAKSIKNKIDKSINANNNNNNDNDDEKEQQTH